MITSLRVPRGVLWCQAAGQTGAAATQVLGAASELSQQAEKLRGEVDTFIATLRAA